MTTRNSVLWAARLYRCNKIRKPQFQSLISKNRRGIKNKLLFLTDDKQNEPDLRSGGSWVCLPSHGVALRHDLHGAWAARLVWFLVGEEHIAKNTSTWCRSFSSAGWRAFLASYNTHLSKKLIPEQFDLIQELIDWLVPPMFEFLNQRCHQFVKVGDIHQFYVSCQ